LAEITRRSRRSTAKSRAFISAARRPWVAGGARRDVAPAPGQCREPDAARRVIDRGSPGPCRRLPGLPSGPRTTFAIAASASVQARPPPPRVCARRTASREFAPAPGSCAAPEALALRVPRRGGCHIWRPPARHRAHAPAHRQI